MLSLSASDGTVLRDLMLSLSATDGTVLRDLAVHLRAVAAAPEFTGRLAQRVSSVVSEV